MASRTCYDDTVSKDDLGKAGGHMVKRSIVKRVDLTGEPNPADTHGWLCYWVAWTYYSRLPIRTFRVMADELHALEAARAITN